MEGNGGVLAEDLNGGVPYLDGKALHHMILYS